MAEFTIGGRRGDEFMSHVVRMAQAQCQLAAAAAGEKLSKAEREAVAAGAAAAVMVVFAEIRKDIEKDGEQTDAAT